LSAIPDKLSQARENPDMLAPYFLAIMQGVSDGNPNELKKQMTAYGDFLQTVSYEAPRLAFYQKILAATLGYWTGDSEPASLMFNELLVEKADTSKNIIGLIHMLAGGNWRSLGEFERAVRHLLMARSMINPQSELKTYAMYAHYQLGEIHHSLKDYTGSERHYLDGLEIAGNSLNGLFRIQSGLGSLYLAKQNFAKSEDCFNQALSAAQAPGQKGRVLYDLATLEEARGHFSKAEKLAEESFQLRITNNLDDAASTSQILIARTQIAQKLYDKAINNLNDALAKTESFGTTVKQMEIHRLLSHALEEQANYKVALKHFRKYQAMRESINSDQQREIFKLKNVQIAQQKSELEEINKEITASITYAKRIQTAILPPDRMLREFLPNSFVLYKPKDIVAGDFYWLEVKGNKVFFAAADCTGHGVPGAMVSVICNNALNRSVREFDLNDPAKILDQTRELVIQEFEKSDEEVKDGMDISLAVLNTDNGALQWAGANNPLWVIKPEKEGRQAELVEVKADKQPIGKYALESPFNSHSIQLESGDTIYLFSDGFPDQFGGVNGKKYKSGKFKRTLIELAQTSIDQQKELLNMEFENWRGENEQIDDVCVIGVKF